MVNKILIIFLMICCTSCVTREQDRTQIETKAKEHLLSFEPPRAYSLSNYTFREDGKKRILGFKNDSMIVSYIIMNTELEKQKRSLLSRIQDLGKFAIPDEILCNRDSTIIYCADSKERFRAVSFRKEDMDHIIVVYKFYLDSDSEYDTKFDLIS
jgi:hypothetical protein